MLGALITFLGSSAGGSILGFLLDWLSEKRQANREAAQQRHVQRLAELNAVGEYTKQLDKTVPGTLRKVVTKYSLWGWHYEKIGYKIYRTNVITARARAVALSLLMCVTAYTGTMLIFAAFPYVEVWTLDPEPGPWKFVWGLIEIPRNSIFVLTTGGIAYLMAHPLVFIISLAITGTARRLAR